MAIFGELTDTEKAALRERERKEKAQAFEYMQAGPRPMTKIDARRMSRSTSPRPFRHR
jgi:hypothetical protein